MSVEFPELGVYFRLTLKALQIFSNKGTIIGNSLGYHKTYTGRLSAALKSGRGNWIKCIRREGVGMK